MNTPGALAPGLLLRGGFGRDCMVYRAGRGGESRPGPSRPTRLPLSPALSLAGPMRAVVVSHTYSQPRHQGARRNQRTPLNPAASAAAAPAVAPPSAANRKQYAADDPRRWWAVKERSSSGIPSSSSSSSSNNSSSAWPAGGLPAPASDLAAALAPLAAACGADAAAVTQAVRCLPPALRQGVVANGCQVAQHLRSLGVPLPLLAAALRRCLPLFSRPPAQHAAPQMAELMAAGLSAAEALRCFERSPMAAGSSSLGASLAALSQLLSAGSDSGSTSSSSGSGSGDVPTADQLQPAAALLREQPGAAAALLAVRPSELHRRAAYLRDSLGLSAAQLAAAVRRDATLLALLPETLEEQAAALQEELGMSAQQFAELASACPAALANLADCVEELTFAASSLAGVRGRGRGQGWSNLVAGAPLHVGASQEHRPATAGCAQHAGT